MFEDVFTTPKRAGAFTSAATQSLKRAEEAGLPDGYGILRTWREGGKTYVVYGPRGRKELLDAAALAYELAN